MHRFAKLLVAGVDVEAFVAESSDEGVDHGLSEFVHRGRSNAE